MPRIKFSITEALIKKSKRLLKNGKNTRTEVCPTALAIKAVLGKKASVDVEFTTVDINFDGKYTTVNLPARVGKFIDNFDSGKYGKPVRPLDFTLNIKKEYLPARLAA